MRLLIIVLSILLLTAVFGFVVMNLEATVSVTVWNTHHPEVPLHLVILVSMLVGIVYIGIIAVAEGVNTRLERRRLAREVQRLDAELNYLRTQPSGATPEGSAAVREPAPGGAITGQVLPALPEDDEPAALPSAPVYGADDDDETDDDVYSGGRAV